MRTQQLVRRQSSIQMLLSLLAVCLGLTSCGTDGETPHVTAHSTGAGTESLVVAPTSTVIGNQHYELSTATGSFQLVRASTVAPRSRVLEFINLPDDWTTITQQGDDQPLAQRSQLDSNPAGSPVVAARTDGGFGWHNASNLTLFATVALLMILTIGVWPSQFAGDGMTGLVLVWLIGGIAYTFLADWTPPYQVAFIILLIGQFCVFGYVKRVGYAVFETRRRLLAIVSINTAVALSVFMLAVVDKPHANTAEWSSAHAISGYVAPAYRHQLTLEDADRQPLQTIHSLADLDGWLVIAWTGTSEPRYLRATAANGDQRLIALAERPSSTGE